MTTKFTEKELRVIHAILHDADIAASSYLSNKLTPIIRSIRAKIVKALKEKL